MVYDDRLLEMTGLDRAKLPELVPRGRSSASSPPAAAADLGVPAGLPVSVGSGDVHSAVFGSGAVADFEAHLYIGTSSWISAHVPFKKTAPTSNVASIPAALAGRYVIVDEHETAGACLTFLRDNLGLADDFEAMNAMVAAVAPGSGRVLFTPWLNGERSPVDDHTVRGGFHNLSLSTTPAQMVRAVYEGVAFNSRWLLEAVEKFAGRVLRLAGLHRRRGQLGPVGPDPRRRARPRDPPGGRSRAGQRAGGGLHRLAGARAGVRSSRSRAWSRSGERSTPIRPRPPSTTSCSRSS